MAVENIVAALLPLSISDIA